MKCRARWPMLSIVVCTYNRADTLAVLLNDFELLSVWLSKHAELIIIDNNSSDDTQELLNKYQNCLDLRIFCEPKQGLAAARNRALSEFNGNAILFLDDDVSISLDSLNSYLELLAERKDVAYVGGKISVDWQGDAPQWLKSNDLVLLNGLFGQYDLGHDNLDYSDQCATPFGANFLLRRELINQVGEFDTRLGVIGQQIGRGEETDYFKRARHLGFKGMYCAKAEVGHRFQKERINLRYLYRYGIEKGRAAVLIDGKISNEGTFKLFIRVVSFLFRGLWQLIKGRLDRFYQCVINVGILVGARRESDKITEGGYV